MQVNINFYLQNQILTHDKNNPMFYQLIPPLSFFITSKLSAGIFIDKISEKILRNVPKKNQKFVRKQLDKIDRNFIDDVSYMNEKY